MKYFLGLDVGGTKTACVLADERAVSAVSLVMRRKKLFARKSFDPLSPWRRRASTIRAAMVEVLTVSNSASIRGPSARLA